jgi:hypothetical protein
MIERPFARKGANLRKGAVRSVSFRDNIGGIDTVAEQDLLTAFTQRSESGAHRHRHFAATLMPNPSAASMP